MCVCRQMQKVIVSPFARLFVISLNLSLSLSASFLSAIPRYPSSSSFSSPPSVIRTDDHEGAVAGEQVGGEGRRIRVEIQLPNPPPTQRFYLEVEAEGTGAEID